MNIKDLIFFSDAILHEVVERIKYRKEDIFIMVAVLISLFLIIVMPGLQHLFNFCVFIYLASFSRVEKKNIFISNLWLLIAVFYIIISAIFY